MGLRKITASRRKTLVQHPGQTIKATATKFGMNLPYVIPYGGFFENFKNSKKKNPKNCVFVNLDLEKLRLPCDKLWYNPQTKLNGLAG